MKCPKCETKIEDSDDYCRKCGEPVSEGGKQKLTLFDTVLGLMLLVFLLLFAWLAIDTYFRIVDNETWRKLFFMAAAGGIGGTLAALNSFSIHQASEKFKVSFIWWYLVRPLAGLILGVVVYLLLLSNLLILELPADAATPLTTLTYSVIAFLAGFASKEVITKLREVIKTIIPYNATETEEPPTPPETRFEVVENPDPLLTEEPPTSPETETKDNKLQEK